MARMRPLAVVCFYNPGEPDRRHRTLPTCGTRERRSDFRVPAAREWPIARRSRERASVYPEPESEKNSARISRRLARDARAGYARDLLIDTWDGAGERRRNITSK